MAGLGRWLIALCYVLMAAVIGFAVLAVQLPWWGGAGLLLLLSLAVQFDDQLKDPRR